ncbi:alpha/beta hydrolase-fold protein [Mucilaginibacter ximonensis]|uniref:Alpha/beta hydrolase-fold protein n=1 Tax=Mucilaginibacter ximonensis TaxID=538021 RepID=A0ABW5YHC9_9SPHI
MKRTLFTLFLFALLSISANAQTLITKKIFSTYVKDSVAIEVYLPKNYSKTEKYPVVYEFIYDHANYIAATASNMWDIPALLVVHADIKGGNDHYKSTNLDAEGVKYYGFVKNELIPYIDKTYNTANLKVAAGLSQGADYINYILRNDPSLFNTYLNFSLERPIYYTPDFSSYTAKVKDTTAYFIAIANDIPERVKFANQLVDSLKKSPYINIQKENFNNAIHSYSILYALPEALLFAFKNYNIVRKKRSDEALATYYNAVLTEKTEKYGNINYNELIYQILSNSDISKSTDSEIKAFIDSVNSMKQCMDIDLFVVGYELMSKGLYQNAEKAYQMALLKKQNTGKSYMDDISVYFQLAKVYDLDAKPDEALKILQEGYLNTKAKNESMLYVIGYRYIDKNIDVDKGIALLKSMLTGKHIVLGHWSKTDDSVNAEIAKGYFYLKNISQAKIYLNKSLKINPKNEAALKLQASLN